MFIHILKHIIIIIIIIITTTTTTTTTTTKFYFLPASPLGSRQGTANIKHIKLIKNIVYIIKTSLNHPKTILKLHWIGLPE